MCVIFNFSDSYFVSTSNLPRACSTYISSKTLDLERVIRVLKTISYEKRHYAMLHVVELRKFS
jgi:hypothetical protein